MIRSKGFAHGRGIWACLLGVLIACSVVASGATTPALAEDGGLAAGPAVGIAAGGELQAQEDGAALPASGTWGTCAWEISQGGVLVVHAGEGLNCEGSSQSPWYEYRDVITEVTFDQGVILPRFNTYLFGGWTKVRFINAAQVDTANVTSMHCMFNGCTSLESLSASGWDTSKVTAMGGMFQGCSSLKSLDVSKWDTSAVTSVMNMFGGCTSLESLDVSGWNTSSVRFFDCMFYGCSALRSLGSLDVSGWDTSAATSMTSVFYNCASLESLDVSGWDTSSVTGMGTMFYGCSSLESLDLSSWNTSAVTSMSRMFSGCSSVETIKLGAETTKLADLPDNASWSSEADNGTIYTTSEILANRLGTIDTYSRAYFLKNATVTIPVIAARVYNGSAYEPAPKVVFTGETLTVGTDYTYSHSNNVNAGTATLTVTGKGKYTGSNSITFEISRTNLSWATATIPDEVRVYSGSAYEPTPTVKYKNYTLQQGVDYEVSYSGNVDAGTATVMVTGKGNFEGTNSATFEISPADLGSATVSVPAGTRVYNGSAYEPVPTVSLGGKTLQQGVDYEVSYSGNVDAGTATVTVTGRGKYTGSNSATFEISGIDLSSATVESIADQLYTGEAITPAPTVTLGATALARDVDYKLSYESNIEVGEAKLRVDGEGNYDGTTTTTFRIVGSKTLGFEDLRFRFGNAAQAFGYSLPYQIPMESYSIVFGKTQVTMLYKYENWSGSCYGMSAASRMFNVSGSGLSLRNFNQSASRVSDLYPDDKKEGTNRTLTSYIEALQVSQDDPNVRRIMEENRGKLEALCDAVRNSKADGRLVGIDVYGRIGSSIAAHTVTAYDIEESDAKTTRIYVYDCNFPNEERYITVYKDGDGYTGWYYHLNDAYNWGTDYDGDARIDYVSYSVLENTFEYSGGTHVSGDVGNNMLLTTSQNFTLRDEQGQLVAMVRDGVLSKSSDGVTQFTPLGVTADGVWEGEDASTLLYVPSGVAYTIKNEDEAAGAFEVGMVNVGQSADVSTGADEVTLRVSDAEEANMAKVAAKAGQEYSVTLRSELDSAKGRESIELTGTSDGSRQLVGVGTSRGNCLAVAAGDASLSVNGESVDIGAMNGIGSLDASLEYDRCTYNGKAHKPKLSLSGMGFDLVEGVDYSVAYKNNVKAGTATVTATGKGKFTGTKSVTFKIAKAKNKVTAKTAAKKKAFKASALRSKARAVALPKAKAKFGKAKWKVVAKDRKGVLRLKSGKVRVKKGAKPGAYTIKLRAKVAGTENYAAATSKALAVKVTVKK